MDKACEDCRFFVAHDGEPHGACHRYPPEHDTVDSGIHHPLVENHDWCGEWKKRKS